MAAYKRKYRLEHKEAYSGASHRHYASNKETVLAHNRTYYGANRSKISAQKKLYNAANRAKIVACSRKRQFGLSESDFESMLCIAENKCQICATPFKDELYKGPYVDHDHKTGRIRGLLCAKCNKALGLFGDSPAVLSAAATYLQKHLIDSIE